MTKLLLRKPVTGTILRDQVLAGYPHKFDVYIPSVPTINFAVVALHGGGGTKETFPQRLGVTTAGTPTLDQVRWDLLEKFGSALIVPQGQHCSGVVGPFNPNGANTESLLNPDGVATWSNWSMWSQADDKAFLSAMSTYAGTAWPAAQKVLLGHSNGGMMVQRVWMEAQTLFDLYVSLSGPMPSYWDKPGGIPQPVGVRPMMMRHSLGDTVLGIKDGRAGTGVHFWDNTWLMQPAQSSVANYTYPALDSWIAGWRSYQEQLSWLNRPFDPSGYTTTPEAIGERWTWVTKVGGVKLTLDVLTAGSHQLNDQTLATQRYAYYDALLWCQSAVATPLLANGAYLVDGSQLATGYVNS